MKRNLNLTGNDLALCMNGVALAMDWWRRGNKAKSAFAKAEREKYIALNLKLNEIFNRAYPEPDDDGHYTMGDEIVLRITEAPRKRGAGK